MKLIISMKCMVRQGLFMEYMKLIISMKCMVRQGLFMEYMKLIISMKCMVNGSTYGAIPQNAVAVPGRVGMAECSLDLIFF